LTKSNPNCEVNPKDLDGGSAGKRLAFENGAVPPKVPPPALSTRIEETDNFVRMRVDARQVRALALIAGDAGQRKILKYIATEMLLGDDMVSLERKIIALLWHLAVFATIMRPCSDQVFGSLFHADQEEPVVSFSLPRTLAFRMDRRWPM
jgi:hypothetical protein